MRLCGLGRIVEDLEVLASAEAAGLALELKPVDLALVAEEAAEALRPQLEGAGLSLTRDLQPAVVRGDKNRLHQVVTNLLTNAIKFTPAGGTVSVSVSSRRSRGQDRGRGFGAGHTPRRISDTSSIDSGGGPASDTPRGAGLAWPSSKSWCTLTTVMSPLRARKGTELSSSSRFPARSRRIPISTRPPHRHNGVCTAEGLTDGMTVIGSRTRRRNRRCPGSQRKGRFHGHRNGYTHGTNRAARRHSS